MKNKFLTIMMLVFVLVGVTTPSVDAVVYAEMPNSQLKESDRSTNSISNVNDLNNDETEDNLNEVNMNIEGNDGSTEAQNTQERVIDSKSVDEQTETIENSVTEKNRAVVMNDIMTKSASIPLFINEISNQAMELAINNDLYSSVMIAQAILESAYGNSELGKAPVNNLFGVKGSYNGQYVMKDTIEFINGVPITVSAMFRKYPSYKESLQDYTNKLKLGPGIENGSSWNPTYYSGAWKSNTKNYQEATKFLTGRYASDPSYNTKLDTLIQTYNLTQYDEKQADIITNLDTPKPETSVQKDTVSVKGWALADKGIKEVEVSINDSVVGKAEYGKNRPDVYDAYPSYNNSNSGYEYTIGKSQLVEGKNEVKIIVTSEDNKKIETKSSLIAPATDNKFWVDKITNGTIISNIHEISGWALSRNGVQKIEILIDGQLSGTANLGEVRNDVYNAYPEFNNKNSGYSYQLDTSKISEGNHRLTVRMIDSTGAIKSNDYEVVKPEVKILSHLEEPTNNKVVNGRIQIKGWAVATEKIKDVVIQVDEKIVGQAIYGKNRPDVNKVYPEFNESNGGYEYQLDTDTLKSGNHQLKVISTTESGKQDEIKVTFSIPVKENKLWVDKIQNGTEITNDYKISGWSLSSGKTSKVEISIDGKVVGNATTGEIRNDVYNAYPYYNDKNAGFSYTLDTSKISEGTHTLKIKMYSSNGTSSEKSYEVIKPEIKILSNIESPTDNSKVHGKIKVSGWVVATEKINQVDIKIDGKIIGQAEYGKYRPDVNEVYPKFNEPNGGFEYQLNLESMSPGKHTLTINSQTKSGKTESKNIVINVPDLVYLSNLDNPKNGNLISDNYLLKGWVLNNSELSSIEISLNNKKIGNAIINLPRLDVKNAYPEYQNDLSGFEFDLKNYPFNNGQNKLSIVQKFSNGTSKIVEITVFYSDGSLGLKGYIDDPKPEQGIKETTLDVNGWIVAQEGLKKVDIYIDGVYYGQADYGQSRLDVGNANPTYNNPNSGYSASIPIGALSSGRHVLKVVGTSNLNKIINIDQSFLKGELAGKKIFVDPGHGGTDPGAVSGGVQEKDLNLSVSLKLQSLLESQGAEVIMSRTTDKFIPLPTISSNANASNADIFVSVHTNSAVASASGIETYSYSGTSRSFGMFSLELDKQNESLSDGTFSTFGIDRLIRSVKLSEFVQKSMINSTGAVDRGSKKQDFHVIRETNMPAILTEIGFVTNPSERSKLVSNVYQNQLASGISNGIINYFKNN
ncbi:hypothetical protein BFC22_03470 [Carnobacterium divergens]|uniref:N-acetylmuramoyl-L-alanine amidase n=1 Tax=Carnobacterium divergens TaxID=2748 RepID=UPI000E764E89|nr:N-acetylmuramoyl-L-alanine amidase [Carnobacterium divergens]ANZ99219.1 hypothetical protein BFC22_03470 [Carnobacterium divergens]